MEDSGLGDEEDGERGWTERREQEHQGEGGRLKPEAVVGESLVCGEAEWEKGGGKLPT